MRSRFALRYWRKVNNSAELKTACESGGGDVTLSKTFVAGAYPGEIRIPHGGTCVFRGKGQVLDARNAGRLFSVSDRDSSLEIHGLVLKNGQDRDVSLSPFHFCFGSIRCKKEMTFSLYARPHHMQRSLNDRRSVNSARVVMKVCAVGTSGC